MMIIVTRDKKKYYNAPNQYKKLDFFVEANKMALDVINCVTLEPTIDDKIKCIYNKTGILINKHDLTRMINSNDIRVSFINLYKKQIFEKIIEKYDQLNDKYIILHYSLY